MTAGTCGACRFAHGYASPGPQPVTKPKPPKHWFWGEEGDIARMNRLQEFRVWERMNARHVDWTRCRRFPDQVEKRKADTCGEFLPALGAEQLDRAA